MGCRRTCAMLLVIVVSIMAVVMTGAGGGVDAARPAPDCFDGESYLAHPSVYEKARAAVAAWMARLPSGPSPGGPGH
uniref:Uncharacterized protein n=1 Tax=Musa acuminata subsp. malaccensis TaxID=214687 RepID=A0A804JBI7_MUSAM